MGRLNIGSIEWCLYRYVPCRWIAVFATLWNKCGRNLHSSKPGQSFGNVSLGGRGFGRMSSGRWVFSWRWQDRITEAFYIEPTKASSKSRAYGDARLWLML